MPTDQELDRAAWLIRNGGLVALPTETVYGLGANALDVAAVERIYEAKGRPRTSPLIVHVASIEMARGLAREWPVEAGILAGAFWPGPLTLVLPKRSVVPDLVTAGLDTVGLRMPAHDVMLAVIRRAQVPIAAPSANRFTEVSPTTAQHVRDSLGPAVMVLDGGPCAVGIESTVLSLVGGAPTLLRPGAVSREQIAGVLGVEVRKLGAPAEGPHESPGLQARHYAPRTPTVLVLDGVMPPGRVAYLWWRTLASCDLPIRMPDNPQAYGRQLYLALRDADAAGVECIAIEALPDAPEWAALRDRVLRATAV